MLYIDIEPLAATQSHESVLPGSSPEVFKLNIKGCEGGPSPITLVTNTEIEMSPSDEQGGEISPNVWQHTPFIDKHKEAGMLAEPQILPEEASVYVMV